MLTTVMASMTSPWALVVALLLILLNRPIRMVAMRPVFWIFGTSKKDRADWVRKEAGRDRLMDALTEFWNRPVRHREKPPAPKQLGPRRADDQETGRAA